MKRMHPGTYIVAMHHQKLHQLIHKKHHPPQPVIYLMKGTEPGIGFLHGGRSQPDKYKISAVAASRKSAQCNTTQCLLCKFMVYDAYVLKYIYNARHPHPLSPEHCT